MGNAFDSWGSLSKLKKHESSEKCWGNLLVCSSDFFRVEYFSENILITEMFEI